MASVLTLVAAFLFALAATLLAKGGAEPPGDLAPAARVARALVARRCGCSERPLLAGYVFQAAALDRGRLSIIQPLLVMTIVFALPLGYFLTSQHVGR